MFKNHKEDVPFKVSLRVGQDLAVEFFMNCGCV